MYYISRNYKSIYSAAGKAKTDCEFSLESLGFKNLGFKQSSIPSSALGTIKNVFGISLALIRLPFKSILCTQYPNNKFRSLIVFVAKIKRCKIITIVHDVRTLKGRTKDKQAELDKIVCSDVIIVHNESMKAWFLEEGVTIPIVVLGIFDYVSNNKPIQNTHNFVSDVFKVAYAGGFSHGKNSYLFDMDLLEHDKFTLRLYGVGFDENKRKVNKEDSVVFHEGAFTAEEVPYKIEADFGLVWDGESVSTCSGQYGEYLKFNNPHKTSLYLLCGLPVIVWDQAAIAHFITDNKLGIAVNNLNHLNETLKSLSQSEYLSMKQNVAKVQERLMNGKFIADSVSKALSLLS